MGMGGDGTHTNNLMETQDLGRGNQKTETLINHNSLAESTDTSLQGEDIHQNQQPIDTKTTNCTTNHYLQAVEEVNNKEEHIEHSTMGWTYAGHGEWTPTEEEGRQTMGSRPDSEPEWIYRWRCNNDEDIKIHQEVIENGYPNRWGARRPVQTKWNLALFKELLEEYEDKEVTEWMTYGWPMGRLPTLRDPGISSSNHKGATEFPAALHQYIKKEKSKGAVMGPFTRIPFPSKIGIFPLSTRTKKESEERRVILDLSFPIGNAVNDGITKDMYLGFQAKLAFPKVDDFAFRIFTLGPKCMMFKVDLSRYFRQLSLDPGDYSLIGYIIEGDIYFDKVLPMGLRSAPYIAQRVANAIAYIHRHLQYFLLNYVDDFVGAELREHIW